MIDLPWPIIAFMYWLSGIAIAQMLVEHGVFSHRLEPVERYAVILLWPFFLVGLIVVPIVCAIVIVVRHSWRWLRASL